MSDAHAVARDQLRAFVERIERVEEEIASLNGDKSDIYKEAGGVGFDKKTLKKVVARRKVGDDQRLEEDALFETYWNAVHGLNLVHARVRENIEEFPASDGSPSVSSSLATREAEESVVSNSPATATETHKRPSINDEPSPEVGPQAEASPAGTGAGTLADREGRHNGEAASADLPNPSDQLSEGGAHEVTSSAPRAGQVPTSNTGEGAACALPDKPKVSFRPNCQHPENCASGSRDHCWSCRRAMQKSEEMA